MWALVLALLTSQEPCEAQYELAQATGWELPDAAWEACHEDGGRHVGR